MQSGTPQGLHTLFGRPWSCTSSSAGGAGRLRPIGRRRRQSAERFTRALQINSSPKWPVIFVDRGCSAAPVCVQRAALTLFDDLDARGRHPRAAERRAALRAETNLEAANPAPDPDPPRQCSTRALARSPVSAASVPTRTTVSSRIVRAPDATPRELSQID